MASTRVVDSLLELGFNLNEARAYVALVSLGAATGYEVAQHAGIPRSAVYTSLRKLVASGAAKREAGPPERFRARPADAVASLVTRRIEQSARAFRDAAASLEVAESGPDAFSVEGYDRILEEGARIVRGARRKLVVSGWPRELAVLGRDLAAADARGVLVLTFSHGVIPESILGARYAYNLAEDDLEAFWKHRLVVVADDVASLVGGVERRAHDRAVVSETAAIAEIAVGQITLDVTLLAQRSGVDVSETMADVLGDRVGRLDSLLAAGVVPELGKPRRRPPPAKVRKPRRRP